MARDLDLLVPLANAHLAAADITITTLDGARSAFYTMKRPPWGLAPLFRHLLDLHYPQRPARIMARILQMRGGKDYDSNFVSCMKASGH